MLDVAAQHAMKNGLPLHFIRFNPDAYTVDGRVGTEAQDGRAAQRARASD
jgi:hypothetical protein